VANDIDLPYFVRRLTSLGQPVLTAQRNWSSGQIARHPPTNNCSVQHRQPEIELFIVITGDGSVETVAE
jgi:hypothetical protein